MFEVGKHVFAANRVRSGRLAHLLVLAPAVLLAGCGQTYRPVVSATNPVGPAGQPTKFAIAVSNPGSSSAGLLTFVDVSGDTILSTPSILANPSYFALNSAGSLGLVINSQGSLNEFSTGNPTSLLTSSIRATTLPTASAPVSISVITPLGNTAISFIPETATSRVAAINASTLALNEEVGVPANPVYVVGSTSTPRVYVISQGTGGNGSVTALEGSNLAPSATLAVGATPVYGVMTADTRRAFILNQGSGTVSVVNVPNNALDTTPTITLPTTTSATGAAVTPQPVWADLSPLTNELVVLNKASDGVSAGTLSIVNIPLCTPSTQPQNPECDATNPVDTVGFGTLFANVKVGVNPQMVSVLQDGTRAYVVNSADSTGTCAAGAGSVSVVSLVSGTVTATLCATDDATGLAGSTGSSFVFGHPNTVSATTGTPTGKVYVTSPDSRYLTVIYTDTDTVKTHINLQGTGLRVLTNVQ